MLYGPTLNEGSTSYQFGEGAHDIIVLERMSSDAYLAHQARLTAFYHRVGETPDLSATPRATRELILRGELPLASLLTGPPRAAVLYGSQGVRAIPADAATVDGSFGSSQFGIGGFGG